MFIFWAVSAFLRGFCLIGFHRWTTPSKLSDKLVTSSFLFTRYIQNGTRHCVRCSKTQRVVRRGNYHMDEPNMMWERLSRKEDEKLAKRFGEAWSRR